jgi:hypothetical protein
MTAKSGDVPAQTAATDESLRQWVSQDADSAHQMGTMLRLQIRQFARLAGPKWASEILRHELAQVEVDIRAAPHRPPGATRVEDLDLLAFIRDRPDLPAPAIADAAPKALLTSSNAALSKKIARLRNEAEIVGGIATLYERQLCEITRHHLEKDYANIQNFQILRHHWERLLRFGRPVGMDQETIRFVSNFFGL